MGLIDSEITVCSKSDINCSNNLGGDRGINEQDICTMTSFDYNYQNSFRFSFHI